MMSLRTTEGTDLIRYADILGAPLDMDIVRNLGDMGFIERRENRLRATPSGRAVLNALIAELLPG